jgi:phospholipid/cholesterol/gamma-HCH transport system permease protein
MKHFLQTLGYALTLLGHSLGQIKFLKGQWGRCIDQCFHMGYKTLPIVSLLSLFIGGVLALQTGHSLSKIPGLQDYLGSIVGLSMCRELGPLMTAFILAGRVGSATAAELASMTVYQEIDALVTMNLSPERLLVLPRILAGLATMPILTIFSIVSGWIGGWLVVTNVNFIALDGRVYWRTLRTFVDTASVTDGLAKAEIFALTIVLLSASVGLKTKGGPREIGFSVTRAVVYAMVSILILDYFVTKILL